MNWIRRFLPAATWALLTVLAGCASLPMPTVQLEPVTTKLPPIRLMIDDGTGGDPHQYAYRAEMLDAMKSSGVFESINATATENRVALYLSVAKNSEVSTAYALVSAATLFLLPIEHDETFTLQVQVTGPDGRKAYSYQERRKWTSSLARPDSMKNAQLDSADRFNVVRNLVTQFLNEVRVSSPLQPLEKRPPSA